MYKNCKSNEKEILKLTYANRKKDEKINLSIDLIKKLNTTPEPLLIDSFINSLIHTLG